MPPPFTLQALGGALLCFGAIVACPVQAQTPSHAQARAAAILTTQLLSMDGVTEITILDDGTAHVRGFHALDATIDDDIWEMFVWRDDRCTIRASAARSWTTPAARRLEVRLDLLKADDPTYGHGRTFTLPGNGRESPVCMQIPAKPPKCRTIANRQYCRQAISADMFCLQHLRIDNPFGQEDALDQAVRAISLLRQDCSARDTPF